MFRNALFLIALLGCGSPPPVAAPPPPIAAPPPPVAAPPPPVAAPPPPVAAPPPAGLPARDSPRSSVEAPIQLPRQRVALNGTPTHRHLAWIVEALGQRQGVIEPIEMEQHLLPTAGPVSVGTLIKQFREWGRGATSAVVDNIEVDDPTYLRATLVVGDKRWRVVVSVQQGSTQMDYVSWRDAPAP